MMAYMKRMLTDALALGLAALVTWSLAATPSDAVLDEASARTEAAAYLSAAPRDAERVEDRWVVTDGDETAWLDARSGELVEIEFAAPR
jgi:type IV secretory pathway TrbL component